MTVRTLLAGLVVLAAPVQAASLDDIKTVVVIYAENRSFDGLYGTFPGADGLANATPEQRLQRDRDGSVLRELPPIWAGLTARGVVPAVTKAQTEHMANAPYAIDDPEGYGKGLEVPTTDAWHKFYENQMQINGGRNDRFAAWADAGGLVMGTYDGSRQRMWGIAREFVLADRFFQGTFGGSYMNHVWLACACVLRYPDAANTAARTQISKVEPDGVTLTLAADAAASSLDAPPKFANSGGLTPDLYAVNTMQPPYQPSTNPPAAGADPATADLSKPNTLPPQSDLTIGDLLSAKGVGWAWYGGAWQAALDKRVSTPAAVFQPHHQPFNYFTQFAPGTAARAEHLRDGGVNGDVLLADIDAGRLPAVTFYKPQGNLNEHPGYANIVDGDAHMADVIEHLRRSPQWPGMLVVVTYDENGGFWDHVAPPKADRWGPGTRIPAIIVSPLAKRGFVDHTTYDTTSILRFVTRRFGLPMLPGLEARDRVAGEAFGDLTAALDLN